MPVLWKYLLKQYLKVLVLCISAFIAVLVTTRLDEIAHFATLGSEGSYILLFVAYQIPYVLPIALPISALISSLLLVQSLSSSHELTAMRACGLSLKNVFAPILLTAFLLSICSFYVVSELATSSHLATSLLKNELRSINPLLMLNNKHLMKLKGVYFDTVGSSKLGESASNAIIVMPNKHNKRLDAIIAGNLQANTTHFTAKNISFLSSLPSDEKSGLRDSLAIENIQKATTTVDDFAQMIQKKAWNLNNDHLNLSLILVRLDEQRQAVENAKAAGLPTSEIKQLQRTVNRSLSEIMRRFSLALAVMTFTVMGLSFGMSISRFKSSRGLLYLVGLTGIFLASYFSAAGVSHLLVTAGLLYFVPHLIMISTSLFVLLRTAKGVE